MRVAADGLYVSQEIRGIPGETLGSCALLAPVCEYLIRVILQTPKGPRDGEKKVYEEKRGPIGRSELELVRPTHSRLTVWSEPRYCRR